MGPEQRHIPTRTCVICRNRREKDVLFRIVRTPDGDIVFDKTGTLTRGEPEIQSVITLDSDEAELLRFAGSAELMSEHPLGEAVLREARRRSLNLTKPSR